MCGRQRWHQGGRIKARWAASEEQTQVLILRQEKIFTEWKHSLPRLPVCSILCYAISFPCSCPHLSGVCPSGCYSYESAVLFRCLLRVVWVGGHCPSSCPPLSLDRGLSLCLRRLHVQLPHRSPSRHHPSPEPSASLSSHLLASCPLPLAAPYAFSLVPFAALCDPRASVPPG